MNSTGVPLAFPAIGTASGMNTTGVVLLCERAQTTDYRSGDREGLRFLGREAGCVPNPPTP